MTRIHDNGRLFLGRHFLYDLVEEVSQIGR